MNISLNLRQIMTSYFIVELEITTTEGFEFKDNSLTFAYIEF